MWWANLNLLIQSQYYLFWVSSGTAHFLLIIISLHSDWLKLITDWLSSCHLLSRFVYACVQNGIKFGRMRRTHIVLFRIVFFRCAIIDEHIASQPKIQRNLFHAGLLRSRTYQWIIDKLFYCKKSFYLSNGVIFTQRQYSNNLKVYVSRII